ncbi:MAG: hypothetical protein LBC85_00320 [Fibromonadaceae bacterium]|jgi:uncharacterized protein (TIGR02145 family)|nr:hypothetical protein [Fibromonadaceae bacterium]
MEIWQIIIENKALIIVGIIVGVIVFIICHGIILKVLKWIFNNIFLKIVNKTCKIACVIGNWVRIIFTINKLENQVKELKRFAVEYKKSKNEFETFFTDPRDGNKYRIVKVGNQTWMAENLRYKMPSIKPYDNGIYYNWEAAQKACPSGWRLPSIEDWGQLVNYCRGGETAGEKLKNEGCGGTDEFNFSAIMRGYYVTDKTVFKFIGERAIWWTSTELDHQKSYVQCIDGEKCYKYNEFKENMFSIRCVKSESYDSQIVPHQRYNLGSQSGTI